MPATIEINEGYGAKIAVYHANLQRYSNDSIHKSTCPFCPYGVLLMRRDEQMRLIQDDICDGCGQHVVYVDVEPGCATLTYKEPIAA